MLRVTIEMVPKGDEKKAFTLAQGMIVNDGTGKLSSGNYVYGFSAQAKGKGDEPPIRMSGQYKGFPRLREDAWDLLRHILIQGDQALVNPDGKGYQSEDQD